MSDKTLALKLKDEGNAFFGASKFDEARAKYSEAIKLDENNAILYSNRAACHLNVKDYAAARNDAFKATEIDPKFSKAWTRLATAQQGLTQWTEAVHSWKQALAALPATNLSSAEAKQKAQYEAGLAQAEAIYQRMKKVQEDNTIRVPSGLGKMPWHLAQGMMDELIAAGYSRVNSSAWVIVNAYNDWKKGVARMKSQKPAPGMKGMLMGSTGALADLSNALLRDERVFHIEDQQFMTMYNQQVMIEVHATNAWTDGEPDIVIEQAIRRHQESGWDAVRKSMDVTVRAWIMRGFMTGGLTGDHGSTVSWLNKAIMLIEWGRSAGKSIDPASRGAIFKDTFLRGVRKLHMSAVLQAYGKKGGLDSPISLEDMYEEAEEVIREMKANPYKQGNEELDPGFVSSFIVYPKSQALSMKGFYHREMARLGSNGDPDVKADHYMKASIFYMEAADALPDDDEQHIWFLQSGLSAMFRGGAPLQVTMPVMKRIRLAFPKMKRIWAHSAMAQGGRDQALQSTIWFEEDAQKALDEGKFTLMSPVMPSNEQE